MAQRNKLYQALDRQTKLVSGINSLLVLVFAWFGLVWFVKKYVVCMFPASSINSKIMTPHPKHRQLLTGYTNSN